MNREQRTASKFLEKHHVLDIDLPSSPKTAVSKDSFCLLISFAIPIAVTVLLIEATLYSFVGTA